MKMHFNKFTAFFKSFKCGYTNAKRFTSTVSESSDVLIKHFGISAQKSEKIVKEHKLNKLNHDHLLQCLAILNSLGYTDKEILDHCTILKRTPKVIQEQYLVLKEAGFGDFSLLPLSAFRKVMTQKISSLKLLHYLPPHVNVPETLIMHLHPKPIDFSVDHFTDDDIFGQVHAAIVKRYLEWRLKSTADEIETLFRVYSRYLKYKSLQRLCENIEIAIDLGFAPKKLLGFGYLLANDPSCPKTVLEEMPYLAGAEMRVLMRRFPKLITVPLKQYRKIYRILKEENIPDSTIQKQMNIFTLAPNTVKARFDELRDIPEMNVFRQSPRILRLILHYHRTRSRLSFMHELQLKCVSMCLLEHDSEDYFKGCVRVTNGTNNINDVLTLLKHLLKSSSSEIEFHLRQHPYHLQVPLVDIEKTCVHVQRAFSNSAIIKVAPILLYPIEKIETALKQISSLPDLPSKRLTQAKKLNLALYLMEKDHHFSGDGIRKNGTTAEAQ